MMVIGLLDLPEDAPLPIHLERRAALKWRLADMRRVGNLAVIEERAALGEIAVLARWVRHFPGMDDLSRHIDEVDGLVGVAGRRKQREARERMCRIVAAKADAAALDRERLESLRRRGGRCLLSKSA